ncbi:MAG: dihydropteroate synthase [Nitrosopumilus sp.]|nr:dihydropteroate synthase [Nitrosopumilus sp.]MDA7943410.1 dihydropteroate synthase [Nitrosopumilus sp.]MDA7998832.1 dihydropteroate synthase [Nitrosopumilus sp.]
MTGWAALPDPPRASSALKAVDLFQAPPPLIIGERLNAQGSRRAKRMVLARDYAGLVDVGRRQAEDGAHCLDVCVDTTESADEMGTMLSLVKRLSLEVDAPLVIDSTSPEVIKEAVRRIPGRPIINSISLEGDGSKFRALAPLMARYGLAAVAICIGPEGMARTPEQKLEVATAMHEEAKKYGIGPGQLIFDVVTFTLGTGDRAQINAGNDTLEGIRLVKRAIPGCLTTLGLSNISFGLMPPARKVINSVFLYHAVRAGLDSAIVNAAEITPYADLDPAEVKLAEDLIFNSDIDALPRLVDYFTRSGPAAGEVAKAEVDPSLPPGKRAYLRITRRLRDGIERDVAEAVAARCGLEISGSDPRISAPQSETHAGAVATLNEDLLPAMKEVGDKFGAGELILPFVLRSAECMKAAVSELEKYLLKKEGTSKGTLVLGTVYGDVHDIGKNLVKTIFQNNGYEVHDLGKQVPVERFIEKAREVRADAIGLSALLVSTSKQMGVFLDRARSESLGLPVLCGGAAVNTTYVNRIAKEGGIYGPGAFYCNTMFDGLKTMDALMADREGTVSAWRERVEAWKERELPSQASLPRSSVRPVDPPRMPAERLVRLGPDEIDLADVWKLIDRRTLLKMSWGVRGRVDPRTADAHEDLVAQWQARVAREGLLEPRAVYGYFGCSGSDGRLAVRSDAGEKVFEFPRSSRPGNLCLADYFGPDDIVAFQAVTVGARAVDEAARLNEEGEYVDAYYLHGVAVGAAEAMAEWVHARVRADLGIKGGLRYSWGYASCPDTLQHRLVWDLIRPDESGMGLTDAGQIVPEASTAAIVVHHPGAAYFEL